jgi:altronate dehydratase small subunit
MGEKMARAILLHPKDNVATLIDPGAKGDPVSISGSDIRPIKLMEDVPYGHKCAVVAVASGQPVIKYGQVIGRATKEISAGQHAHVHNVEALRARGDISEGTS